MTFLLITYAIAMTLITLASTNTLRTVYNAVLSSLFGDTDINVTGFDAIAPQDIEEYIDTQDGVYQIYFNGYSVIGYFTASRILNILAFGNTVAFTVQSPRWYTASIAIAA
jgi:hypothetical protein